MPAVANRQSAIRNPQSPWHAQLRRIHAIGREFGLSHDDLHDACGVTSLKHLTGGELMARTNQMELELQRQRRERFSGPRVVLSPYGDASYAQRAAIDKLFGALRWPRAERRGWLQKRFDMLNHWSGPLTNGTAHEIISQLGRALHKGPGGRVEQNPERKRRVNDPSPERKRRAKVAPASRRRVAAGATPTLETT